MSKSNIPKNKKFSYYYFTVGLIMPLIVSVFTVVLGRDTPNNLWILDYDLTQATLAIILGVFVGTVSYFVEEYVLKSDLSYEKAVLLGLLSAEVMVFVDKNKKVSMATITLLLFFYFHSIEN